MPKISTVICIYNSEATLKSCILSVLEQTVTDIEVILVDDGSTDNSIKICEAFEKIDSRVKVLHTNHEGPSAARNKGLDLATGEFVMFSDSDDFTEKNAYMEMLNAAKKHSSDLVICGFNVDIINRKRLSSRKIFAKDQVFHTHEEVVKAFPELKAKTIIDPCWNKLFKRDIIEKNNIRMPVGEVFEDIKFVLDYLKCSQSMCVLSDCYYHYVQHMGSISKSYNEAKLDCFKKRYVEICDYIGKHVDKSITEYLSLYYVKCIYSCIGDTLLPTAKVTAKERKALIKKEIGEFTFKRSAATAKGKGFTNFFTLFVAKSNNVAFTHFALKCFNLLKYRMSKFFWNIK